MANNVGFTPGSGAVVATDDVGGAHVQLVKLIDGAEDSGARIGGDAANGLDVDVTRVSGNVTVVDGGGSLTVDGAVGIAGSVMVVDGGGTISTDTLQLPVALVGGRLDVNIGASATIPVSDGGTTLSVDDGGASLTVDGGVTAAQGAPNTNTNGWPAKITDGTNTAGLTNVGGNFAVKVDVVQDVANAAQTDKTGFVEGAGKVSVAGAVFNDTIGGDPAEDQATALRITQKKGLHVNLRAATGAEIGTLGAPIRTDPTGTTTQPVLDANSAAQTTALQLIDDPVGVIGAAAPTKVSLAGGTDGANARAIGVETDGRVKISDAGTTISIDDGAGSITVDGGVTANITQIAGVAIAPAAAGIPKVGLTDEAGVAFSDTNPLPINSSGNLNRTIRRNMIAGTAGQTAQALLTPSGGTKLVLETLTIKVSAGGLLQIFFNANTPTSMVVEGNFATDDILTLTWPSGHPADAINHVLRYTTDGTAAARMTVFAYEV